MNRAMPQRTTVAGFTLVEMLITVAVLGILAGMAIPTFREFIAGQRVRTATSDLYSSIIFARSEAMKRNAQVNIVRAGGAGTAWENGWTVQLASTGTVLQQQDAINSITIVGPAAGTVSYLWSGRPAAASSGASFTSSSETVSGITARCISVELSGMPRIKQDIDGNAANGCQ